MTDRNETWDRLSETWRQDRAPAGASDLAGLVRAREARARWRMWGVIAMEVVVVAMVVVFTATTIARGLDPFDYVHLAAAWATVVAALTFTVRNRRGIWRPAADTTLAFLATAEERARRKLRTARFAIQLTAAQSALVVVLILVRLGRVGHPEQVLGDVLFLLGVVAVYVGWALWFRRRAIRELDEVRALRSEWLGEGGGEEPL